MAKILFGTHYISEDEPCMGLFEMDFQSPGNKGFHRYQVVYVMRGDKPAEYRKDLGQSTKFKADQFRIPGGAYDEITDRYYVEHTVGELRDIADHMRVRPVDKADLPNLEGKGIWGKLVDQKEQKINKAKGRVVIGR